MYYITTCRTKGVGANLVCRWFFNYMKQEINKESVYLLRYVGRKEVKIGMSRSLDPRSRIADYGMYSIHGVEVLGVVPCLDGLNIERSIHKEFKHKKIKGKWFELTDEDIEYIINKYSSCEYKKAYEDFLYKYIEYIDNDSFNVFNRWCHSNIKEDEIIPKNYLYNKFIDETNIDVTNQQFYKWLYIYMRIRKT